MNCTFSIIGDNGAAITVIPPGRYQILVTSPQPFAELDLTGVGDPNIGCSHALSFRLTGPGVSLHTTLEDGDGSADQMQATFQVGTYTAAEDRRPTMRSVITVASGAANPSAGTTSPVSGGGGSNTGSGTTKPSTPTPTNLRGMLAGSVSTAGKLSLTFKGKTVSRLKAGRYKITVLDETGRTGFTLQKVGRPSVKVTGTSFLGRHSVTLTLQPGQWIFFPSPGAKKSYFVVTA
jgi:hypothetical protein